MTKPDDARLAEALRANLKKRKDRARAASAGPEPSFGSDEEGDVLPSDGQATSTAGWVREGS